MPPQQNTIPIPEGATLGEPISIPQGASIGDPEQAKPTPEPSFLQKAGSTLGDMAKGVGKGAMNTLTSMSQPIHNALEYYKPGLGESVIPQYTINRVNDIKTPQNTAQKVGYYGEQLGEFLLPTGLEEGAASAVAKLAPRAAKYAVPVTRIGEQALESGTRNVLQGGDFGTGAIGGGLGAGIGQGMKAAAPKLAESALGVTYKMRGHGKTIGDAALNEIKGIRPSTLYENANTKISQLTGDLENRAADASSKMTISQSPRVLSASAPSTKPAINIVKNAIQKADAENSPNLDELNKVLKQLTTRRSTGQAIPEQMTPTEILSIKRGIGDLVKSWSPDVKQSNQKLIQNVYGALDGELDRTVAGAQGLNQRISSLIPVKQRSAINANGADFGQRVLGRFKAHTGALAGSALGAHEGYKRGGPLGMVAGAATGAMVPELIASPS
jgi:hypothetical protein